MYSGDVGMIVPGSNALKVIDRKKNIFKLSQGEYVAPDKLQNIYKNTYSVADIFVAGDPLKSCLVGIVVADEELFPKLCVKNGLRVNIGFQELIKHPDANRIMLEELGRVAKENKLKGFERLKRIYINPKNFAELDLITTTFKVKRFEAEVYFKELINELYKGLD